MTEDTGFAPDKTVAEKVAALTPATVEPDPEPEPEVSPEPTPEPYVVVPRDQVDEYASRGYQPGYVMLAP